MARRRSRGALGAEADGGGFARGAAVMLTATIAGQGAILLSLPILTRLYSTEAVGLQALYLSWASNITVLATLRLDLAVVIARTEDDASHLARMILLQTGVLVSAAVLVIAVFGDEIAHALGTSSAGWLWLIAPMIACTALVLLGSAFATRNRQFGRLAALNVSTSVGFVLFAGCMAIFPGNPDGMVIARLASQALGALLVLSLGLAAWITVHLPVSIVRWRELYFENRQFLYFNTPYSFISAIVLDMPLYVLAARHSPAVAAQYGLAKTLLIAPTTFLSAALSQVYYKEVVDGRGSASLENLTQRLLSFGLLLTSIPFLMVGVWGEFVFTKLFGSDWAPAGHFAQLLAPAMWICAQTGWIQRAFEAGRMQRLSFGIQITFDGVVLATVLGSSARHASPYLTIGAYSALFLCNSACYIVAASYAAQLRWQKSAVILVCSVGAWFALLALILAGRVLLGNSLMVFVSVALVCPWIWLTARSARIWARDGVLSIARG